MTRTNSQPILLKKKVVVIKKVAKTATKPTITTKPDYLRLFGVEKSWDKKWLEGIKKFESGSLSQYVLIDLLKCKPIKEFRKSLQKQLIDWLESTDRKYDSPLSSKQMYALRNKWAWIEWQKIVNPEFKQTEKKSNNESEIEKLERKIKILRSK